MAQKQKIYKEKSSIFVKGVVAVFLVFCAATIFSQLYSYTEMELKIEQLEEQKYSLSEDIEELEEELDQEIDDEYIEKVARSMLNYHLPEEILFFNDLIN